MDQPNYEAASNSRHPDRTEAHSTTATETTAFATHDDRSHTDLRTSHLEQRSIRHVSGGSNNFNSSIRRHSHTGIQSKTRPLIRSTATGTKLGNQAKRRRAKFMFGDQELEEESHLDVEQHQQQPQGNGGPSTVNEQISQHEHNRHTSSSKQSRQENQDSGQGPNSETIPNTHQRNHSRRIEPSSSMGESDTENAKTEETTAKIELGDSDSIRLMQSKHNKSNSPTSQPEQYLANVKPFVQTHNAQKIVSQPNHTERSEKPPSSTTTAASVVAAHSPQTSPVLQGNTRFTESPTVEPEGQSSYSTQQEPSKRLSRLLHPSRSTTSLASITRTISHPVLSATGPSQSNINGGDHHNDVGEGSINSSSATVSALSATLKNEQSTTTSPVVDLVSMLLNPISNMRSRSYSNLSALASSSSQQSHPSRFGSSPASNDISGLGRYPRQQQQQQQQQQRSSSTGASVFSPPRANDTSVYLISRFLPNSPSQPFLGSSAHRPTSFTSTTLSQQQQQQQQQPPLPPPQIKRRRVPANLQMTSSAYSPEGGPQVQSPMYSSTPGTPTIPSRPATPNSISSVYSSTEGRSHYQSIDTPSASPWNPDESMSRTQQKLMLQKQSSQDDMDENMIARRSKSMREMERIQRDYRCVCIYADPLLDSLARCQEQLEMRQRLASAAGVIPGIGARQSASALHNTMSSLSVKSMQ